MTDERRVEHVTIVVTMADGTSDTVDVDAQDEGQLRALRTRVVLDIDRHLPPTSILHWSNPRAVEPAGIHRLTLTVEQPGQVRFAHTTPAPEPEPPRAEQVLPPAPPRTVTPALRLRVGRLSDDTGAPIVHQINDVDADPRVVADVQVFARWAWQELREHEQRAILLRDQVAGLEDERDEATDEAERLARDHARLTKVLAEQRAEAERLRGLVRAAIVDAYAEGIRVGGAVIELANANQWADRWLSRREAGPQ